MRPARLQGAPQPRARHASLNEALERAAVSGRRGLTFVSADESETALGWDEVRERASRVAGALADLGVRPGERVALVLPTGPDFMDAFFGALLAGAVPVPLYPPVRLGRLPEYHATTARMTRARWRWSSTRRGARWIRSRWPSRTGRCWRRPTRCER